MALRCRGGTSKGRPVPPLRHPTPQVLHRPPGCLQIPPMPLFTINRGCGVRWKSAPFISKLSKLLQALQLSSLVVEVVQQQSRARAELLSEFGRVFWVQNSSFVILSFIIYFIQYFISCTLFSIIALLSLSTCLLLFIISELRCLLLGISSIGYLLTSSLLLVPVPPSGQGPLIPFHRSSDQSSKPID